MVADGGHGRINELVQRVYGRERGPKEYKGGSGVALNSQLVAHRGRGARVAAATAREARREGVDLSAALVGVD